MSREVAPGRHRVEVWNTLVRKRLDVDLAPGEHARFSTANRAGFGAWMIALLGVGPIYVTLEREAVEPPPGGAHLAR